jgi:hypothetical protein
MKMKYPIATVIMLVIIGCTGNSSRSDDFDFVLKYGVAAGNIINTFEGTYTKDMVVEPDTTIDFLLSPEEMAKIRKMMVEVNVFDYPNHFDPPMSDSGESRFGRMTMPYPTYELKIRMGDREHEIIWHDSRESSARKALRLRKMILQILKIIHSKEKIENLPPAKGAYL